MTSSPSSSVSPRPPPAHIEPDTFLARIAKTPDDIDAYLVYADWLQQQGDPRGEFILLCHHAEQQTRDRNSPAIAAARDQAIVDQAAQLLGDLHGPLLRGEIEMSWRLVIAFFRVYWNEYLIAPPGLQVGKAIRKAYCKELGSIYKLFEHGPGQQIAPYAGIPRPIGGYLGGPGD